MSQMGEQENDISTSVPIEPVTVSSKTARRFYEIVALLLALNKSYEGATSKKSNDLRPSVAEDSDEHMFHNFVSRLGQICDSRPGGSTVTAFAVLQHPDRIEYVFGCNGRKTVELETTRGYIHAVLSSLKGCSDCDDDDQREEQLRNLLRDVLIFNRDRVHCYLKALTAALEECIRICRASSPSNTTSHQQRFTEMLELVKRANQSDNDDEEFWDGIEELLKTLQKLEQPAVANFLRKKASDSAASNTAPWKDLQHCSSRLLAYKRAVDTLWDAGSIWPALFDEFEVTYIPSSKRASNPLQLSPQTAADIISRIVTTSDESKRKYQELATSMQQRFGLDKMIEEEWISKSFRPIVHAEPLVLSWLEVTGGTRPERFFGNWPYIGCSKPACKLCDYYFSIHPSGVQIRSTHGNLYRNWRMPEYVVLSGMNTREEVLAKRQDVFQGVMSQLKQYTLRVLNEKTTDSRPCDSATISTFARRSGVNGAGALYRSLVVPRTLSSNVSEVGSNGDWDTVNVDSEARDGGTSLTTEF